jgi:hypothetical protein
MLIVKTAYAAGSGLNETSIRTGPSAPKLQSRLRASRMHRTGMHLPTFHRSVIRLRCVVGIEFDVFFGEIACPEADLFRPMD